MEKLRILALRTGLMAVLVAPLWAQHGGGHGGGGHGGGAGFAHAGAGHSGTGVGFGHSSSLGHGFAGFGAAGHAGVGHVGNVGFSRPAVGHGGAGFSFGQFPSYAVSGFGHGYTGHLGFGNAGHYFSYYPYNYYGLSFGGVPSYWPYPLVPTVYPPAYPIVQAPIVIQQGAGENRPGVDTSIWLVALDGGLVRAVRKFWLEGEVFHYVLRDGTEGSMPLSEVDLSLTEQLNRERGLIFRLPKPGPESPSQIR